MYIVRPDRAGKAPLACAFHIVVAEVSLTYSFGLANTPKRPRFFNFSDGRWKIRSKKCATLGGLGEKGYTLSGEVVTFNFGKLGIPGYEIVLEHLS